MPPVIVPTVQVKVPGIEEVKLIAGLDRLHVIAVGGVVTAGEGLTVTMMLYTVAGEHKPSDEVGITRYSTVPASVLLGLRSTWSIKLPDPSLAPVIFPVIVPTVQVKVLGIEDVKLIAGLDPLQVIAVAGVVTTGDGFTVTMIL
jgi:hypothetical protein